jgi:hypothetical protein
VFELSAVLDVGEPGIVGDVLDCEFGVVGDVGGVVDGYEPDGRGSACGWNTAVPRVFITRWTAMKT